MAGAGGNAIVTYMNGSTGIMSQAQVTALEAEGGSGANSISSWAPYNGAAALGTVTAPNITSQTPGLQSSGTEMPGANVVATINANNPSSTLTNTQENSIVATRSAIIDQLNTGNIGNVTIAPSGTSFITTPSNLADKSVTTISTSPSGMITSVSPTATTTIINGVSSTINAAPPTVIPITNTQDYYKFSDGSKVSQTQYDGWTDEQQFNYQKSIGGIPPDAVFIENKGGGWGYSKTDTSVASIADFTGKSPMVINPDGTIDIGKSLAKGVTADYIISHTTASMSDINQAQASNTVMGILNGSKYQQGDQYLVAQAVADNAITLSQANKAGFSVTQSDVDNAAKQELQTNSLQSLSKSGVVTISANGNEYAINWDKVTPSNYTDLENIGANFADMVKAQEASGFVGMVGNPTFSTAAANISGNKNEVWIPSIKGNTTTYTAETPNAGGIPTSGTELNVALANINSVLTDKSQKASDSGQVNELNRLIEDSGLWDNSKLGKTTYLGGQTFYTDSKGHVLTSQDQVNIMWNSLTPAQQSQIASNYNQKTNPFAELTIEEQESANQAGFVGQMVWNPVLGVTTPFAELSVGQHVSASQWENAAVTGLLDVSMIGGTNVLNSGSMFGDLSGSEKAASYLTGGLTTGAAAINLPNTIATVTNSKDTLEQKAMAVGGEVLISDTGLRELGMTTPSSFAQTYLIPKVSVDFAKIGNNLSNYATAMEGGIDEGISNPISIQAPKIENLVGTFNRELTSQFSGSPLDSTITTGSKLSYTPPDWMTKTADYVSNIGRNWFPTTMESSGTLGDFSLSDLVDQQKMPDYNANFTQSIPETSGTMFNRMMGITDTIIPATENEATSFIGKEIGSEADTIKFGTINIKVDNPQVNPYLQTSLETVGDKSFVQTSQAAIGNDDEWGFNRPREVTKPAPWGGGGLDKPEVLGTMTPEQKLRLSGESGVLPDAISKGRVAVADVTIENPPYKVVYPEYIPASIGREVEQEAGRPYIPDTVTSSSPLTTLINSSLIATNTFGNDGKNSFFNTSSANIGNIESSYFVNPVYTAIDVASTLIQLPTVQPNNMVQLQPSINTLIQPATSLEAGTSSSILTLVSPSTSTFVSPVTAVNTQTAVNTSTQTQVSTGTATGTGTSTATGTSTSTGTETGTQAQTGTQTQTQVEPITEVVTTTGIGTIPPPDVNNPNNFLFFPPEKKKDKKKNKKTKNEKQTIQQYQYLFSKTPELDLHMPTGSQLTKGGILGGELAERRVTTVEPSHNVEEGVKITTRTYNRTRGKRSADYRGITRTNLAVA